MLRGVAQRAEGDWQAANPLNLGKRVGLGSMGDAVESFARAIAADSTNAAAGRALYQAGVLLRDTAAFRSLVLPSLRRLAAAGAADTGVLLALARAERFQGDSAAAVVEARRYVELGGTRGLGLRELAWCQFSAGIGTGDSAYYAGAQEDDSVSVAAYREDLAFIADDSTLTAFDGTSGEARAAWLRRFWENRDRQALRAAGERLREHYRRLTYAERAFGLEVNRRHYAITWTDMYRSGSTRFDDRGIVYLRYGPPDQRAATNTTDIMPNETWRYHRADGDLLLNFAANSGGDIRDYRLVPSVTSIEGVDANDTDKAATWFAFDDRCPLYPPFCKALGWGSYGRARVLAEERTLVENSTAVATRTDGYELRFRQTLDAAAAAFAVGREPGGRLVHVVYQVALQAPAALPQDAVFRLPLRIRANLFDAGGHSGGWIDTTTTILLQGSDTAEGALFAVGRATLVMPPGKWRYRIALAADDSSGIVLPTDSLELEPIDGARLALSDLVLSKGGRGARWVPEPGDTAFFNPRRTWRRRDTIALYHEIYGLPAGRPYTAKLVVRKGKRVALTLRWDGFAPGETARVSRTLSFETVRPGDYELEVEVRDAIGRKATTSRRIRITD
jgi:GWxTD domain-containing protein